MGCDSVIVFGLLSVLRFNSRTPCGVRLPRNKNFGSLAGFNSRTPCGVRPESIDPFRNSTVSIHAPRVGCDLPYCVEVLALVVSIHAPRVGCDSAPQHIAQSLASFNSRTPCGVRLEFLFEVLLSAVSIHAPRVGCDSGAVHTLCDKAVSIHAPRVGCDSSGSRCCRLLRRFNSRTPCGVRPLTLSRSRVLWLFQFTHPVWGATGWSVILI